MKHIMNLFRIGLIGICTILMVTTIAWGTSQDVSRIPNGSVFSCDTCHSSGFSLNSFGTAYNAAGRQWTQTLANQDSDGDGFPNGTELQDPTGSWRQGNPDPGDAERVSNPGDAGSVPPGPTPTPTVIIPTVTPTGSIPTATPTTTISTPTPTPPSECSQTAVTIHMPDTMFHPGDLFYTTVTICNAESAALDQYPLFVILDIMDNYFFAPAFSSYDNYLTRLPSIPMGITRVEVLPEFEWPEGAGTMENVMWYAALTDPEITDLFGAMDSQAFGWSEP